MRYLFLLMCFSVCSLTAQTFTQDYKRFYDVMHSAKYYQMEASIKAFTPQGTLSTEVGYQVKMLDGSYFMRMGDSERILNDDMVVSMNEGMKSIIVSERLDKEFELFTTNEYFSKLDSLDKEGVISLKSNEEGRKVYLLEVNKGPYNKMLLTFHESLLSKMEVYYNGEDLEIASVMVNFKIDLKSEPSKDMFSLNRYASINDGQYELKPEYKNFELSIN